MSIPWNPSTPPPSFTPEQQTWLSREFFAIKRGLEDAAPLHRLQTRHVAPDKFLPGMLVLADGSDWNPGYGAGMYRRNEANDAWIFCAASPMETVIAPTLLNSWVDFGGTNQTTGYWKDSFGIVHLRGLIKSGAPGTVAFVLPAGYLPSAQEIFATNSNNAFGGVYVLANGNVIPTSGSALFFSLAGITFRAA